MKKLLLAHCVLVLLISVAQAAGDSPPNVVLIISDDQGFTCLLYTSDAADE